MVRWCCRTRRRTSSSRASPRRAVPSKSPLPSEIEFASFLVYNPKPAQFSGDMSRRSRQVRNAVKKETAKAQRLGERMRGELGDDIRARFFPAHATLVPMSGHAPMKDPRSHWAARDLCEEFARAGLGARMLPLLRRVKAVPKAASVRPSADLLYESLLAVADLAVVSQVVVV